MKLLLFTMPTTGNIFLTNRLSENFNIAGMVILKSESRNKKQVRDFWLKKIKRFGFIKTLNKFLYYKASAKNDNSGSIEKSFFYPDEDEIGYKFKTDILNTYNINSIETAQFIMSKSPDLIAVCGSNIIKPEIFTLPPKGTINIHVGITPFYRSANPVEWALYNKDFDKIGVTIHFVDEGLDTGRMIYQKTAQIEKGDTVASLYCKNIVNGTELMVKTIKDIEADELKSFSQPLKEGKHYLAFEYGYWQNRKVNNILKSI